MAITKIAVNVAAGIVVITDVASIAAVAKEVEITGVATESVKAISV